jgi:CheY-like chemotaxis protein
VLVVDDDPWIQRMVSSVLSHAGHTVDLAGDGWEGLVAADRLCPDLLVVDVKLPTADGWKLLETLRARPEMANLRALILTPFTDQHRRGAAFRPNVDHVLVSPFRLEDLTDKVGKLLASLDPDAGATSIEVTDDVTSVGPPPRVEAEDVPTAPAPMPLPRPVPQELQPRAQTGRSALLGNLQQFGASSVLMLLDLERRSGVLILNGTDGRGRFYLREGRILRATVDGQPHLRGALAVYPLLTWTEGRFEFHAGEVTGDDEIRSSTSFLLMEGARRQDEHAAEQTQN